MKVVFVKDNFHVFKSAQSETFFSYFYQILSLEKMILRNIKILSKVVFFKRRLLEMFRWQKIVTSINYNRKIWSKSVFYKDDFHVQNRFILNQSFFQINITRVIFGPKT